MNKKPEKNEGILNKLTSSKLLKRLALIGILSGSVLNTGCKTMLSAKKTKKVKKINRGEEELLLTRKLKGNLEDTACALSRKKAEDTLRKRGENGRALIKTKSIISKKIKGLICVRDLPSNDTRGIKKEDPAIKARAHSLRKILFSPKIRPTLLSLEEKNRMNHAVDMAFKLYLQPSYFNSTLPPQKKAKVEGALSELISRARELDYQLSDSNIIITPRNIKNKTRFNYLREIHVQKNGAITKVNDIPIQVADWKKEWKANQHKLKKITEFLNSRLYGQTKPPSLNEQDKNFYANMSITLPRRIAGLLRLKNKYSALNEQEQRQLAALNTALGNQPSIEQYKNGTALQLKAIRNNNHGKMMITFIDSSNNPIMTIGPDGKIIEPHGNNRDPKKNWRTVSQSYKDLYNQMP